MALRTTDQEKSDNIAKSRQMRGQVAQNRKESENKKDEPLSQEIKYTPEKRW